jgi:hypothetical protein
MSGGGSGGDSERQQALQQFNRILIPSIEDQELDLARNEYIGDYQAQMENALNQQDSEMNDISIDPRLRDAQMSALESISEMGETGFTPAEQAALREARRNAASEDQAKSAQLLDEYARRGMGGSGAELAARLQAGQSSADRLSQEGDRLAQMSQQRALDALSQQATLGSQIRGQDFGEQSDIARAQDAINQFNTANQQSVQSRNVANTNAANMRNLTTKQGISTDNTGISNQEQQLNKQLIQQRFQNEIQKAGGQAQALREIAASKDADAAASGQQMGNILGAAGTVVGAVYGGPAGAAAGGAVGKQVGTAASDERVKKDVKPFDVDDFLESLSGYEFHYKKPEKHGEGKQVGVMAQDVEKEAPQLVDEDDDGTKRIDYNKAGGPIFASLAGLHERLKKLEG